MPHALAPLVNVYRDALLEDVLPFWLRHSIDREHGGYFTCLERDGSVYDTDKFMWLQARQVWLFSALYNRLERRDEWLNAATLGAKFLLKHGMDTDGSWYFALNRQGQPLVQPYNIYSDCFAAMAMSQYALATGDDHAKRVALDTFQHVQARKDNPKRQWSKAGSAARPFVGLGFSMMMCALVPEMRWQLGDDVANRMFDEAIESITQLSLDRERMILFENVLPDGSHADCFDGRVLLPGHGIEAMWFVMDIAEERGDRKLIDLCTQVILSTLKLSWDDKHGGIYYVMDAKGTSPDRLDWDQKLWWVHNETLIALLKAYRLTGNADCLQWFHRVHDYTWSHFPDPTHGEWFGYLTRAGEPLLTCKGGKWKGCFHVPRGLYVCWKELERIVG